MVESKYRTGLLFILVATGYLFASPTATAINIVLDYTLDANNNNWFGGTPDGLARRASVDVAAGFLSAIITNDDWESLPTLNESFSLSDIAASSITDISGSTMFGSPESDGLGFSYDNIATTNRSSVAENEYIIYVSAFDFDASTTSNAKGGWESSDRRNAAGFALTEFNTWGGKVVFNTAKTWYSGANPGINPSDDYGFQDPNKSPTTDISTDNWDWSTSSDTWKGFDLKTIDAGAISRRDLYATTIHELMHALGATSSNFATYVGQDAGGNNLLGPNVVAEFGGPVPRSSSGHFATNTQSTIWNSEDILSETVLDPNSLSGVRKYFTKLDAALLRDLGYNVVEGFSPADFNTDTLVDSADLALWEESFGVDALADANGDQFTTGTDFLIWQREFGGSAPGASPSIAVPEPSTLLLLIFLFSLTGIFSRAVSVRRAAVENLPDGERIA